MPRRSLRTPSRGPARPAWDLRAAAVPASRSIRLAQLRQKRAVETPRKLGEFHSLAQLKLAPRAGDTSGKLRAPRLLAGGLCQLQPAPTIEPSGRRSAPGPPSASPSVAPPAPACGTRTSLRRPHQLAAPAGRHSGGVWGRWPRRLLLGCLSRPRDRVRRRAVRLDSLQCLPPSNAALPNPLQ